MTDDYIGIVDALHRYAAGIDQRNGDLLSSAFVEDTVLDFRPAAAKAGFEYPVIQGREAIVQALLTSLAALDTTHSVSNPRVASKGDSGSLDALVEAQHHPSDDHSRHFLMKNRYVAQMVSHGGMWRIRHILINNLWMTGDPTVLAVV